MLHGLYLILGASGLDDLGCQLETCCFLFTFVNLTKASPAKEKHVVQYEVKPSGRWGCQGISLLGFE